MEKNYLYRIDGILYEAKDVPVTIGDLVLDTDGTYGYVDYIQQGRIQQFVAVKHDWVTEVGIPMKRLRKLIPSLETNSVN